MRGLFLQKVASMKNVNKSVLSASVAILFIASSALAATTSPTTAATNTVKTYTNAKMKANVTKPLVAKPAAVSAAKPQTKAVKTAALSKTMMASKSGNMVTTMTTTGKKITYDCSKAGNKNKTACK